jgi:hypothetical protein
MTPSFAAGIAGLAFVDSFNPATLAGVALILLSPVRRGAAARAYVLGAYAVVLAMGTVVLLSDGADLPNAFPYLVAIERLVAAGVPTGLGVLVLALYAVVYCLPCLVLLLLGTLHGERVRRRLGRVYDRIGRERTVPRSLPAAARLTLLAAAAAVVAATA